MARFLLIHGSCHGAWCWRDTIAALETQGHEAIAIDLPSHGDDPTPVGDVTLPLYAQAIVDALDGRPAHIVGHSMAGYPITAAGLLAPDLVERLVYLCAYLPHVGLGLADMRRAGPSQPLANAIIVAPDRASFTIDPNKAGACFYHDVVPKTAAWAISKLCPQAILPQETALDALPDLPRSYIRCMHDRTIPPAYQVEMSAGFDTADIYTMERSHSPFLSDPEGLATILTKIANS
ncbi:MAG: alpha/beta fold hydrolase [Rhodobacteraceae bacterium]|nr:alpha/beta fold hydrolase [Paracoccaceae bacterium]